MKKYETLFGLLGLGVMFVVAMLIVGGDGHAYVSLTIDNQSNRAISIVITKADRYVPRDEWRIDRKQIAHGASATFSAFKYQSAEELVKISTLDHQVIKEGTMRSIMGQSVCQQYKCVFTISSIK